MDKNDLIQKIAEEYDNLKEYGINEISPYLQDLMNRYQNYAVKTDIFAIVVTGLLSWLSICWLGWVIIQRRDKNSKSLYVDDDIGYTAIVVSIISITLFGSLLFASVHDLIGWINIPEIMILKDIKGLK